MSDEAGMRRKLTRLHSEGWPEDRIENLIVVTYNAGAEREAAERIHEDIHDELPARARPGPPVAGVRGIDRLRAALDGWTGPWPPTQADVAEVAESIGGKADRTIRYWLKAARSNYRTELDASAERRRAAGK